MNIIITYFFEILLISTVLIILLIVLDKYNLLGSQNTDTNETKNVPKTQFLEQINYTTRWAVIISLIVIIIFIFIKIY